MKSAPLILAALVAALWSTAPSALAQTVGNSIAINGSVGANCYLLVNQNGTGQALDIVGGVVNQTVGSVGEVCNRGNGFTVTLSSGNGGALVSPRGDRVPYTVQYDNSGVRSLSAPVVLTRTFAKPTVWTRSFRVNVPAVPQAIAGSYSDTVTLTIAAR